MTKATVVLDTNVLASGLTGFRNPSSTVAQILHLWRAGWFTLITSEPILTELSHTLQRPYFRQRLTLKQISGAMNLLKSESAITPMTTQVQGIATHPEDDLILATAISANAAYLVTGDTKLARLGRYKAVTILSPRRFLETLKQEVSAD
jgi:putative PIN family toxin of toxin-antitoxin system